MVRLRLGTCSREIYELYSRRCGRDVYSPVVADYGLNIGGGIFRGLWARGESCTRINDQLEFIDRMLYEIKTQCNNG